MRRPEAFETRHGIGPRRFWIAAFEKEPSLTLVYSIRLGAPTLQGTRDRFCCVVINCFCVDVLQFGSCGLDEWLSSKASSPKEPRSSSFYHRGYPACGANLL